MARRPPGRKEPALFELHPLVILAIGIFTILGLIIVVKANAFLALIAAAMIVSVLAPGDFGDKLARVAGEFGIAAGKIGIVIAMAAIIGQCMLDSGSADRVVRAFLHALGEKRAGVALLGSGYVLSIPVFFDTVFYLLVPLARSLFRTTGRDYLKYVLAIAAGAACTHTLVPPTPGPLALANLLGVDVGTMILIGAVVAVPSALMGLLFATVANRMMPLPARPLAGQTEAAPLEDRQLPSLFMALLPVILPVILISANTAVSTVARGQAPRAVQAGDIADWPAFVATLRQQAAQSFPTPGRRVLELMPADTREAILASGGSDPAVPPELQARILVAINEQLGRPDFYDRWLFFDTPLTEFARGRIAQQSYKPLPADDVQKLNRDVLESAFPGHIANTPWHRASKYAALVGDPNFALFLAALVAMFVLKRTRSLSLVRLTQIVETSLMSAGVIILITAAGGAFGAMLKAAGIGDAIKAMFGGEGAAGGMFMILLGFVIAAVLKVAQGSSTVAMITAGGMMAAMGVSAESLGFHPVYLATAIGSGSLVGVWMNDSGFWVVSRMSGLTEVEALKTHSLMLTVLGTTGLATSCLLAAVLPLI